MGIKNLHKFFKKHVPSTYAPQGFELFAGKRIAVDIPVYLYKYKSVSPKRWLNAFAHFMFVLLEHDARPIAVYDTRAPAEKKKRQGERRERRCNARERATMLEQDFKRFTSTGEVSLTLRNASKRSGKRGLSTLAAVHDNGGVFDPDFIDKKSIQQEIAYLRQQVVYVSREDIDLTKRMLQSMGIPTVSARTEAEAECAYMCIQGLADAVMSEDTDVLVYGPDLFFTKVNATKETCVAMRHSILLDSIGLSRDSFRDLCIMSGTDYNENIWNIGCEKAYNLLVKYTSIEGISVARPDLDISTLKHTRVRELFHVPNTGEYKISIPECTPDATDFLSICREHHLRVSPAQAKLLGPEFTSFPRRGGLVREVSDATRQLLRSEREGVTVNVIGTENVDSTNRAAQPVDHDKSSDDKSSDSNHLTLGTELGWPVLPDPVLPDPVKICMDTNPITIRVPSNETTEDSSGSTASITDATNT